MKKIIIILVTLFSILVSIGCNSKTTLETSKTVEITDMLGETVIVNKNPSKVACCSRTTYDLLVAFGLKDKIDGAYKGIYDNSWVEYIYPESKDEYRYAYQESYETFISRGIDLVFSPEKYITDGLKEHGITAINVSLYGNPTFDNYVYYFADLVKQIWDSKDVELKVNLWKEKVSDAFNDVTSELSKYDIDKKKIMYVRGDKNKGIGYTDTKSSFTEYVFRTLGFDYAGNHFETNSPSKEAIVEYNPDYFVIGGIYQHTLLELLKNDEVYKELDAVKNGNYITIPVGFTMFEQLSVMTPIFIYDMANKIYPEYFNYDIKTMVKETIKEYFNIELTDSDVINMLNGNNHNGEYLS